MSEREGKKEKDTLGKIDFSIVRKNLSSRVFHIRGV